MTTTHSAVSVVVHTQLMDAIIVANGQERRRLPDGVVCSSLTSNSQRDVAIKYRRYMDLMRSASANFIVNLQARDRDDKPTVEEQEPEPRREQPGEYTGLVMESNES